MSTKLLEQPKMYLKDMFHAGIKAVLPKSIIQNKVKLRDKTLHIDGRSFTIQGNVYVVGFGKAVMGMAITLENILGDQLKKGIVSIPNASKNVMWESEDKSNFPKLDSSRIEYREGAVNNQPDDRALETTHAIIDLVEALGETDTLIVLISGGGSALLYMPRPVIDPDDKMQLCKALQNAGADITELNTVRRKLSLVKGGGLARMAYPASVVTLILSDIVGDPIDLIASGPTVYSDKMPEQVIAILKKYDLFKSLEGDLKKIIISKETFDDQPLLSSAKEFKHVTNIIVGNNEMAIQAASTEALRKKLTPIVLRSDIKGHVHDVSLAYVEVTSLICLALEKALSKEEFFEKVRELPILALPARKVDEIYDLIDNINKEGLVLIGGGEPTVVVKGKGKGGRNQELALYFSLDWLAKIKSDPRFAQYDVVMLSAGTDGQDGPTDAAGAFGYPAIGPIMHDLYAKIKSMALQAVARAEEKEVVKTPEEPKLDTCKPQVLSGFLSSKVKKLEMRDSNELQESVSDSDDSRAYKDIHPLELQMMEVERMLPENTLKENDSYNFYSRFKKGADLLKTGYTDTNVMDLHFVYVKKRTCCCESDVSKEHKPENILDIHDLHIDPETVEKYRRMHAPLTFQKDMYLRRPSLTYDEKEKEHLNIKIIDENLAEPCCNKKRKFWKSKNT